MLSTSCGIPCIRCIPLAVLKCGVQKFWWQLSCRRVVCRQSTFVEDLPRLAVDEPRQISLDETSGSFERLAKAWRQIPLHDFSDQFHQPGFQAGFGSYASLLRLCESAKALCDGRYVHQHIIQHGLDQNLVLGNCLLKMYSGCGALEDAIALFCKLCERNVFSWSFLITAHAKYQLYRNVLDLFNQMLLEGVIPDRVLFVGIISACAALVVLAEGKRTHARILGCAFKSDDILTTALLNMYGKCGHLNDALRMFHAVSVHDEISWNSMIGICCQLGNSKDALCLFHQMQFEGMIPNKCTYVNSLSVCTSQADLLQGKRMHTKIIASIDKSDILVGTALASMYGRCGSFKDVENMFADMQERDIVLWNAIIAAYAQNGHAHDAFQIFGRMQEEGIVPNRATFVSVLHASASDAVISEGKQMHVFVMGAGYESDLIVGNALVTMYSKWGSLENAQRMFNKIAEKDVFSWTALITAYAHHGQINHISQIFSQMQQDGLFLNEVTLISILSAYANPSALLEGKLIHAWAMTNNFISNVVVGNALINMYGKCGSLEDALNLFNWFTDKDVVSWNAIISAYTQNKQGKDALRLFEQMQLEAVVPNKVTFVNTLSACVDEADLLKGKQIHALIMSSEIEMDDTLGNATVNMYGKCGAMVDAHRMFVEMGGPTLISWNSMIAGYAQHGHGKYALRFLSQMWQEGIKPDKSTFISLLSACSHAGLIDEAFDYFIFMDQQFNITPTVDHFNCMVDLFGRSGRLAEAEDLVNNMPFLPTGLSWASLLSSCRHHLDVERGECVAKHVYELVPEDTASFVMLSNICTMGVKEVEIPV